MNSKKAVGYGCGGGIGSFQEADGPQSHSEDMSYGVMDMRDGFLYDLSSPPTNYGQQLGINPHVFDGFHDSTTCLPLLQHKDENGGKGDDQMGSGECRKLKKTRSAEVHNMTERIRRQQLKEKIRCLQELIPNCNKRDKASILDDAIKYIKNLQLQQQTQMMSMQGTATPHEAWMQRSPNHNQNMHIPSFSTCMQTVPRPETGMQEMFPSNFPVSIQVSATSGLQNHLGGITDLLPIAAPNVLESSPTSAALRLQILGGISEVDLIPSLYVFDSLPLTCSNSMPISGSSFHNHASQYTTQGEPSSSQGVASNYSSEV